MHLLRFIGKTTRPITPNEVLMLPLRSLSRMPRLLGNLVVALGVVGCQDGPSGPETGQVAGISAEITLDELGDAVSQGPLRVEVDLLRRSVGEALVAREVEVEEDEDLDDREEIEALLVDLEIVDNDGFAVLEIGGLAVQFTSETEFRDEDGGELTFDEFVMAARSALDAEAPFFIEAKRRPAGEPQAPDDDRFVADRIEIEDDVDDPKLELNIDADNIELNDAPPPDAWLNVLGLQIELRTSEGITDIERDEDEPEDDEDDDDKDDDGDRDEDGEFEGLVREVDLENQTFTLDNGTIVRIVEGTEVKSDDEDHLRSLTDVADALEAGLAVEAEGEGIVESTEPLTIVAEEVEFELDDDDDENEGEFEGLVTAVDLEADAVTLDDGTVVRIVEGTEIKNSSSDDKLGSLAEVAEALEAGRVVEAEGKGVVQSTDPLTIVADEVEFEVEDDDVFDDDARFERNVSDVNLDDRTVTLTDGTIVKVVLGTEIKKSGKDESLHSLAAVESALDAGRRVRAKGRGILLDLDPRTIIAEEIEFEIMDD